MAVYLRENNISAMEWIERKYISERIISSVIYLQRFFNVKPKSKIFCLILQVLEDVKKYFLRTSAKNKVDLVQDSFVKSIRKLKKLSEDEMLFLDQKVLLLSRQEEECLYFCYFVNFSGYSNVHYNKLFKYFYFQNGYKPNGISSDAETLSYFKNLRHLFFVKDGIVTTFPASELNSHPCLARYVFKIHDTSKQSTFETTFKELSEYSSIPEDNVNDTFKAKLKLPATDYENNLIYKKLKMCVSFLLYSFRKLSYCHVWKCISYVFPDIRQFLNELSLEEQQKVILSTARFKMKDGMYFLTLKEGFKFFIKLVSKQKLMTLHIVSNLALSGGEALIEDLLDDLNVHAPLLSKKKLRCCAFWRINSDGYVSLDSSFYSTDTYSESATQFSTDERFTEKHKQELESYFKSKEVDVSRQFAVPKCGQMSANNFTDSEISVLQSNKPEKSSVLRQKFTIKELSVLCERTRKKTEWQDKLNCMSEYIRESIAHLLKYFKIAVDSKFLEIVLHVAKIRSLIFRLKQTQQQSVIKTCLKKIQVDDQRCLTCSDKQKRKTSQLSEEVKIRLCMSYIINEIGTLHHREVFQLYKEFVDQKACLDEMWQIQFFKGRGDFFSIDKEGYVNLVNVPKIKLNYVDFIVHEDKRVSCKANKLENNVQYVPHGEVYDSTFSMTASKDMHNVDKVNKHKLYGDREHERHTNMTEVEGKRILDKERKFQHRLYGDDHEYDVSWTVSEYKEYEGKVDQPGNNIHYMLNGSGDVSITMTDSEDKHNLDKVNELENHVQNELYEDREYESDISMTKSNAAIFNTGQLEFDQRYKTYLNDMKSSTDSNKNSVLANNSSTDCHEYVLCSEAGIFDTSEISNACDSSQSAALYWSEISIFEEDVSYYNDLIDFFIAKE